MKGIIETEERGRLGRRGGQRLRESLLLEKDMGGGLLLHWDQTVGTGASIGLARHGLNKRETAMRNSGDDNYDDYVAEIKAAEEALEAKQKPQPSFELSGKHAAETNRVRAVNMHCCTRALHRDVHGFSSMIFCLPHARESTTFCLYKERLFRVGNLFNSVYLSSSRDYQLRELNWFELVCSW